MRRPDATAMLRAPEILDVAVPGGAVAVECTGDGVPILLLHGWALDRRVWLPQLEGLADRHRLIAIDRRGFGRSSAPPGLAAETGDVLTVMTALGIEKAVIAGMSQGGRIALRFAVTHPDRVAGLILQGAPLDGFAPAPRHEDAIPLSSYAALAREGRLERMKELWRGHALMRAATPEARARIDALVAAYQGRDLLNPGPDSVASLTEALEDVYPPALIVTGEHDTPWRQLVGDALAYGLPHSHRARIAGADHLCNLTHPQAYNDLVAAFVGRIAEKPADRVWRL
jgi:pimeloyl-ACP methyl ester carboxylesterase